MDIGGFTVTNVQSTVVSVGVIIAFIIGAVMAFNEVYAASVEEWKTEKRKELVKSFSKYVMTRLEMDGDTHHKLSGYCNELSDYMSMLFKDFIDRYPYKIGLNIPVKEELTYEELSTEVRHNMFVNFVRLYDNTITESEYVNPLPLWKDDTNNVVNK